MTNKTTFRVIDVPRDTQNEKIPASGAELNTLAQLPKGSKIYDDDKMYPVSTLDRKAIYQNGEDRRMEQSKIDVENRRTGVAERQANQEADRQRHAEFDAQRAPIAAKKESLQAQLKALDNDLSATPADKQALRDQIAEQDQSLQDLADQEYPKTGKGKTTPKSEEKTQAYVDPDTGTQYNIPLSKANEFLKLHPKARIAGQTPPPQPPPVVPQPWGQHSTPTQDIQRGVQNAPTPTPNIAAVSF